MVTAIRNRQSHLRSLSLPRLCSFNHSGLSLDDAEPRLLLSFFSRMKTFSQSIKKILL